MDKKQEKLSDYTLDYAPLYKQLKRRVLSEINSGNWAIEDRIPSETELSKMFGVSRITVRSAINELADEGVLVRIQGKGTYIVNAKAKNRITIDLAGFAEHCAKYGMEGKRKMLDKRMVPADEDDIEKLGLKKGDQVFYLKRLFSQDGVPCMISEDRLGEAYSFLMDVDLETNSLNQEVLARTQVTEFHTSNMSIELTAATEAEAELMEIPKGAPLLLIYDLLVDQNGQPVRSSKVLVPGHNIRIFYTNHGAPKPI